MLCSGPRPDYLQVGDGDPLGEYSLIIIDQPDPERTPRCIPTAASCSVSPVPILRLVFTDQSGVTFNNSAHPAFAAPHRFVVHAELFPEAVEPLAGNLNGEAGLPPPALFGQTVSESIYARDTEGRPGVFFVFNNLNVRGEGPFRLRFHLVDLKLHNAFPIPVRGSSVTSSVFQSPNRREFSDMSQLARCLIDQGVIKIVRRPYQDDD
ncbi:velvet factor [Polychytrium aggregatum]|uniref:velvet factor n=1 Tax=Polychytrium aggregatum TaxID=110093 RepID=UPI0022FE09E3|nr:velvet factor [Polychytrium aggregatum]KAI9190736.1 velvet factor [Polychytrium aggregatum]